MTIPTGFVKSTIQAPGAASSRTRSAISSTTGTVRIALAKPPAPVVSWPMQPQASGAVSSCSRAVCPPTRIWNEHEVRSLDGRVQVVGDRERAGVAGVREHARRHAADDLAPLGVDVVQHEVVDVEAREPRDELGRVRRPAADDGDLHPFTPVRVTPSTKARWARKNRMITGAITSSVAAIVRFHCTWCSERNSESPIDSTQWWAFSPV